MKRRGVFTLVMAMELMFIAVLLILFSSLTSYAGDGTKTQELLIAEDLALLLDTMQSSPYDFQYEYETSLYGKNITIEDTKIAVVDTFNINEITKALLPSRYFSKAPQTQFPALQSLQGSLLIIRKTNKAFNFEDQGGSLPTDYIAKPKRTKEELAIRVTHTDSMNQGQNTILKNLQEKTQAELGTKTFTLEPTNSANLDIIFSFADATENYGETHRITYSLARQEEVEYLAQRFQEALTGRLNTPLRTDIKNYNNRPTIAFHFLNTQEGIIDINNDAMQNIIALTIAGYFDQTYKEETS